MTERSTQPGVEANELRNSEVAESTNVDVTAVIVSYNSADHLEPLALALSAGVVVPARTLVVDNASRDDTERRARDAGFEVCVRTSNDGFGAGCNEGLRLCDTDFVLFCNPDVRPSPQALQILVRALTSNSSAAIAGCVEGRDFSRITRDVYGFLPKRMRTKIEGRAAAESLDNGAPSLRVDYAVGAFILCRVAALHCVGGFDERFFLYCEEEDLSLRLLERGWQTILVPSAQVWHEHGGSSPGADTATTAPLRLHSRYLYYQKHRSQAYAEIARCAIAICVALDRAFRVVTGQQQVYSRAAMLAPFRDLAVVRRNVELIAKGTVE